MDRLAIATGQLFTNILPKSVDEQTDVLLETATLRLLRIVSIGHSTPKDEWYIQNDNEWVVLLSGHASLQFAEESVERPMVPGAWMLIPKGVQHRVIATAEDSPSIWLALHYID